MAEFRSAGISIAGIAVAVPSKRIDVDSFKPRFGDDTVEKFKAATGIHGFYRALEGQTASDLGFAAAEHLLGEKNIDRHDIGLLIFVTQTMAAQTPQDCCKNDSRCRWAAPVSRSISAVPVLYTALAWPRPC